MTAVDLVHSHPDGLTEKEIREGLEGNLCRCTGYHNIVKAIAAAHPLMHAKAAGINAREEKTGGNDHGLRRHRRIRSPQGRCPLP